MKKIFLIWFLVLSVTVFAEDLYLHDGKEKAVDTNGEIVPIDLSFIIDDELFVSEKNPFIVVRYDNDRYVWSNLNKLKEVFSKAEEWYETAKKNNVRQLSKKIATDYNIVSSKKHSAYATITYMFLLTETKSEGLRYYVIINEIKTPSLKNEYIDVYTHKLFIQQETIKLINSKLSEEGIEQLKKELSEEIENRKKTLELFN